MGVGLGGTAGNCLASSGTNVGVRSKRTRFGVRGVRGPGGWIDSPPGGRSREEDLLEEVLLLWMGEGRGCGSWEASWEEGRPMFSSWAGALSLSGMSLRILDMISVFCMPYPPLLSLPSSQLSLFLLVCRRNSKVAISRPV